MAYVSKETKKGIPEIKKVLVQFGVKGTIKIDHGSTLCHSSESPWIVW